MTKFMHTHQRPFVRPHTRICRCTEIISIRHAYFGFRFIENDLVYKIIAFHERKLTNMHAHIHTYLSRPRKSPRIHTSIEFYLSTDILNIFETKREKKTEAANLKFDLHVNWAHCAFDSNYNLTAAAAATIIMKAKTKEGNCMTATATTPNWSTAVIFFD